MTVRDVLIALCFTGSTFLVILGGWNYMKGRINLNNEKIKADKLLADGNTDYGYEAAEKKIRKEKTNALIMFAAGTTGIFIVIAYISGKKNRSINSNLNYKNP